MQKRRTLPAVALLAVLAVTSWPGLIAPASAGGSGNVVGTVNATPTVRSITVSPGAVTLSTCYDTTPGGTTGYQKWQADSNKGTTAGSSGSTLKYPTGWCISPSYITITNTGAPGHVNVQGTDANGANGTGTWTLDANPTAAPGPDQYNVDTFAYNNPFSGPTSVGATATCDGSFSESVHLSSGCGANTGDASTEFLGLQGPSAPSATDTASTFTFTTTWTAVP